MEEDLKQKVFSIYEKAEKKLSEKTKGSYFSRLKWVKNAVGGDSGFKFLDNSENVISAVERSGLKPSGKKLVYISLLTFSRLNKNKKEASDKYDEKMRSTRDTVNDKRDQNEVSDKKTWATWKEVCSVFDMIPMDSFDNAIDKVIVGLYTRLDYLVRLDFVDSRIYQKDPEIKKENYLVWDKDGKFTFFLNVYKNSSRFGQKIIKITDLELEDTIDDFLTKYNKEQIWLLPQVSNHQKSMTETQLSSRIKDIFTIYLKKPLTLQVIRQIKETSIQTNPDYYKKMTIQEQDEEHSKLLHSTSTAREYRKIQ